MARGIWYHNEHGVINGYITKWPVGLAMKLSRRTWGYKMGTILNCPWDLLRKYNNEHGVSKG